MSFSGTLLILMLFLEKRFLKDKISRQWQYYSFWGRGKFDGENLSDNGSGDNSGYFFRKTEKIG